MRDRQRVRDLKNIKLTSISEEKEHGIATVVHPGMAAIKLSKKSIIQDLDSQNRKTEVLEKAATVLQTGYRDSKVLEDEQRINDAATLLQSGYKTITF